jgi:AraC-like DNA-binding protein
MSELISVRENPVVATGEVRAARHIYHELFRWISAESPESPACIHAGVARLLALIFCARQKASVSLPSVPSVLRRSVERMRLFYFEPHTVESLARLEGLSATHFSRVFKQAFGTSPIDWLRRERISQAKRRLADTGDDVKEIASQVGYSDRYFFSKDFKKHTGFTPTQYRAREAVRVKL